MVCDHGLRPPRLSWQIWVIPVLGFVITTSSAQPVEMPTTNIRATYRSIGVHRTRFRPGQGAAPSEKDEFGLSMVSESIPHAVSVLATNLAAVDARIGL